jgi:hypothetical protein
MNPHRRPSTTHSHSAPFAALLRTRIYGQLQKPGAGAAAPSGQGESCREKRSAALRSSARHGALSNGGKSVTFPPAQPAGPPSSPELDVPRHLHHAAVGQDDRNREIEWRLQAH